MLNRLRGFEAIAVSFSRRQHIELCSRATRAEAVCLCLCVCVCVCVCRSLVVSSGMFARFRECGCMRSELFLLGQLSDTAIFVLFLLFFSVTLQPGLHDISTP